MQKKELKEILNAALSAGADFAEIFIEQKESTVISCEDSKIEKSTRVLIMAWGFVSSQVKVPLMYTVTTFR